MKRIITNFVFLTIIVFGYAQTDSIKGNQYELKGKMITKVHKPFACGVVAWGYVWEFEIIEFSDSKYKNDSIGVIFTCPHLYGDGFFEIGKTYNLVLADKNQANFEWTIPNKLLLDKYELEQKLWVINAKKIE